MTTKGSGESLTIGAVAKMAEVNIQTLRYYERIQLLKPIHRRESGYRIYNHEAVRVVRFVKHAQELGFSLGEIKNLLSLKAKKPSNCDRVREKAQNQLSKVKEKIGQLRRIETTLVDLIQRCHAKHISEGCPILECLDDKQKEIG
ncbi:MAG: heavy metal-responsive transcriptional regulator [Bacteriovoracia bacterium]